MLTINPPFGDHVYNRFQSFLFAPQTRRLEGEMYIGLYMLICQISNYVFIKSVQIMCIFPHVRFISAIL